jgi:hypothetical protein
MDRQQADALAGEFRAASDEARRLAEEFSSRELSQPPAPGAWSAEDNFMHLAVATQALVRRMSRTLGKLADAGKRTGGRSRPDWLGRQRRRGGPANAAARGGRVRRPERGPGG